MAFSCSSDPSDESNSNHIHWSNWKWTVMERKYVSCTNHLNIRKGCGTSLSFPRSSDFWLETYMIQVLFRCRYEESEKNYRKFLELKPGNSVAEKELSQLLQAQSTFDSALKLYDSGEYTKPLEYIDKVVLVFSPACSKVSYPCMC